MTDTGGGRLEQLVERCVGDLGLDLEAVELSRAGKKRVLRVVVDADGGVPIETITEVSRELSKALDSSDVMGQQPYTLEVTSRGVDRPLTLPRHWRRNVGRLVVGRLADGSRLRGRILDAGDDTVEVEVDGTPHTLALADVEAARIEAELTKPRTHAPRPQAPKER